jgi:hypothetical protein
LKTKRTLLVTPALIFIILTAIMPSSMISAKAEVQTYVFSVDPTIHDKYGLTYPVTYMFSLPNGASGLIAYRRFTLDESWVRIDEKTSNDLFNGIEAARFDYPNKKAYVSVALASYSDSIYIYFTDSNGNQINSNYLGTAPYYDNRGVTVVFTIDDLGAAPPWGVNEDFTEISTAFADAKVWWTGAVVTNSINDWQTLQDCVNRGYFEVASHSREHPDYTPYDNYDSEIGGSRDDICSNLTLAYSKGSQGYVWGWVEPSGKTDDTVQQKLTQYHYLVSRGTAEVFTPVNYPSWNSTFGIYDRSNTTVDMDFNSIYNLNGYFDSVYASGGIYHAWGHVGKLGWTSGGVGYEHLQYIAGKKDVWYVGYGALYAYAYTRDNFQTMSVTINPTTAYIAVGGSQEFTSTVTGRLSPYTYQWYYANGTAISGATTSSLAYKANFTGTYSIYLNITDSLNYKTQSNTATINVYSHLNAFISPTQVTLYYGQSQTFSVLGNGGSAPYTYQWYINDTAIPGATNASWTFTPRENGNYRIYANLTDSYGVEATSNVVNNINVYSVHLMLNTEPQGTYAKGQQVTFKVTVLNQQNPKLETTLTLTITGPGDYGFYDFQPINMSANSVFEYSFNCVVPNVAGTYVVEVSLVPAQLTAYEAKWIEAGELPTGLGYSSTNSLVVSKSLVNGGYAIFVLVGSQALSGVYSLALPKYKGKKLRTFSRALPISRTNMLWRLTGRL